MDKYSFIHKSCCCDHEDFIRGPLFTNQLILSILISTNSVLLLDDEPVTDFELYGDIKNGEYINTNDDAHYLTHSVLLLHPYLLVLSDPVVLPDEC